MMSSAFVYLLLNILSLVVLSFYSMLEMACVSFNKVRLQYYVNKGMKRAVWLNYLLHQPSRLFGTTLIGVNVAMVSGSEFAREFHSAIGVSPDLAPLSQVAIVVIFGELAPMFAARRYAEHVAILGIPIVYASAKLMIPLLWILEIISKVCNFLVGGKETDANIFLSQDELQKILEEQDEKPYMSDREEFNAISTNIFNLKTKDAWQIMEPLQRVSMISSNATVMEMRQVLLKTNSEFLLVYHREITNIVGIIFPRDVIRAQENRRVREYARPPWFITKNTKLVQILKQFRRNNQNVAIILDPEGRAKGVIHLYDLMEEIFGKSTLSPSQITKRIQKQLLLKRTFPGNMKVFEFNEQFGVILSEESNLTLSELLEKVLGHHPEKGESIFLDPFEITVKKRPFLGLKALSFPLLFDRY